MLRKLVLAGVALALVSPAVAGAQDPVEVGRDGDVVFVVGVRGGDEVCPGIGEPGSPVRDPSCRRVPVSPYEPAAYPADDGVRTGLVVERRVAAVDVAGVRTPTVELPGGAARAVLVRVPDAAAVIRFLAADGTLVGAAQDVGTGLTPTGRVIGRTPGDVAVRGRRTAELSPTPLQPDRTVPGTCLSVLGELTCADDEDRDGVVWDVVPGCAPQRSVLAGLLPERAERLRLVYGTGATATVAAPRLPADAGPGRYVARELPRGLALRRVELVGAAGDTLRRTTFGVAPGGRPCTRDERDFGTSRSTVTAGLSGPPSRPAGPLAEAAPGVFVADDAVDELCTRVGTLGRPLCAVPPVDVTTTFLTGTRTLMGGPTAADVAAVRFRLGDGSSRTAPTVPGDAYAGRYAGTIRFVSLALPAGQRVTGARGRSADGRDLGRIQVAASTGVRIVRRADRVAPGLRVERQLLEFGGDTTRSRCLAPVRPTSPESGTVCASAFGGDGRAFANVGCAPRRAVLYGELPRGATGARVELAGGGVLATRILHIPGVPRSWTLVAPRTATVAAVRFTGRLRTSPGLFGQKPRARLPLRVDPAARQCGYAVASD